MSRVNRAHANRYVPREDLAMRQQSLIKLMASLRDSDLCEDIQKRILNHAVWEITIAHGNFRPRYRSKGVCDAVHAEAYETRIQREHIYQRKKIVSNILDNEDLDDIANRILHCIVTVDEATILNSVSKEIDGWDRYRKAGVKVFDFSGAKLVEFAL